MLIIRLPLGCARINLKYMRTNSKHKVVQLIALHGLMLVANVPIEAVLGSRRVFMLHKLFELDKKGGLHGRQCKQSDSGG